MDIPQEPSPQDELELLTGIVSQRFQIFDRYIFMGAPTFKIDPGTPGIKASFKELVNKLKGIGYLPFLRREGADLLIRVIKRPPVKKDGRIKFYILLAVTLAVIFIDGLWRSETPWIMWLKPGLSPFLHALLYTVALFGVISIHELGHTFLLKKSRVEASPPYFIPGIPGLFLPTFGAIIMQKETPTNRDQLFDLGFSGPVFGVLATILVAFYAVLNSYPMSQIPELTMRFDLTLTEAFGVPPLFVLIQTLVTKLMPQYSQRILLLDDPITFVAYVGMIITFLNTLPAWQLDGGHMSMAVLGPRLHSIATTLSIGFMILIGFFPMAMLVLFLWSLTGGRYNRPLDDYSNISLKRKILFLLSLLIAILCAPLPLSLWR